MSRINTNVPSSVAQANLARSHRALQTSLQRLSTGLRINVGKDDPAGLIASELLRTSITSLEKAVANSERANQLIATADSALGQVSSLLNDIRGLVSEAANTGVLSDEQIQANQLQVDSSLEAIDRIAQTTAFQGRKLLDGTLDFTTTAAGNANTNATATVGSVSDGFATATLSANGTNNDLVFTAKNVGPDYNGFTISITSGATGSAINVSVGANTLEIMITGNVTASNIVDAVNNHAIAGPLFSAGLATSNDGTGTINASADDPTNVVTSAGAYGNTINLTAVSAGTGPNSYTIQLTASATAGSYLISGSQLEIRLSASADANNVRNLISASGLFTATVSGTGLGVLSAGSTISQPTGGALGAANLSDLRIDQANFGSQSSINVQVIIDTQATQGTLVYSGGNLSGDVILEIGGKKGFEVFNFGSGNTIAQIRDAINLVGDATGVSASLSGSDLVIKSTDYGEKAFVSARALSGTFATYDTGGSATGRDEGSDVSARINGVAATGDGLRASINTSTLDVSFKVNSALQAGDTVSFSITGGGAIFQLGPEVVSNQQARVGIQGVNTATLGGASGTLFELRTGGAKALAVDVKGAAAVVNDVISKVTSLRGRLGAFQKTTLETNIFALTDTLQALTDAESSIRDADFAKETAALTRAQILVQSGTSVLTIANQNPQQVLALLR